MKEMAALSLGQKGRERRVAGWRVGGWCVESNQ